MYVYKVFILCQNDPQEGEAKKNLAAAHSRALPPPPVESWRHARAPYFAHETRTSKNMNGMHSAHAPRSLKAAMSNLSSASTLGEAVGAGDSESPVPTWRLICRRFSSAILPAPSAKSIFVGDSVGSWTSCDADSVGDSVGVSRRRFRRRLPTTAPGPRRRLNRRFPSAYKSAPAWQRREPCFESLGDCSGIARFEPCGNGKESLGDCSGVTRECKCKCKCECKCKCKCECECECKCKCKCKCECKCFDIFVVNGRGRFTADCMDACGPLE